MNIVVGDVLFLPLFHLHFVGDGHGRGFQLQLRRQPLLVGSLWPTMAQFSNFLDEFVHIFPLHFQVWILQQWLRFIHKSVNL